MTRHHGALLALWLALPARAAVVEVKVLAMPVAGAARHAPPAVAPPSLLLAPSALAPVPLPASRGEGILAKLGLRAPRGIDVQLDLLFDGSLPQASGLWEPSAELAKADTEVQGLSPELARDLVQVSRLPEDRQRLVVRQLSGTPIRVRGPPAFSDDHTFSLEIEFQVSRQLAGPGPLPGRLWERARRAVALRALEAAPAGWRLKGDPRGASNTLELNTGGANGAFHVNTPAEWAELVAGLERLD
ncbi:MAG: hypothetical protein HY553_06795, partial [Elusimicrobia bacterium]|nr:hypothetical protein [Elusimicrobiota bacterium]